MIQPEMQSNLDMYTKVFNQIKENVKDEQVAAVILQEVARDRRVQQNRAERQAEQEKLAREPATPRQLEFLRNLGMTIPAGLTKQEASLLIDEGRAKRLAERLAAL